MGHPSCGSDEMAEYLVRFFREHIDVLLMEAPLEIHFANQLKVLS